MNFVLFCLGVIFVAYPLIDLISKHDLTDKASVERWMMNQSLERLVLMRALGISGLVFIAVSVAFRIPS